MNIGLCRPSVMNVRLWWCAFFSSGAWWSAIKKDKMGKASTGMWHPLNIATCPWNGRVKGPTHFSGWIPVAFSSFRQVHILSSQFSHLNSSLYAPKKHVSLVERQLNPYFGMPRSPTCLAGQKTRNKHASAASGCQPPRRCHPPVEAERHGTHGILCVYLMPLLWIFWTFH